jgi:phosphate transport system permease protein
MSNVTQTDLVREGGTGYETAAAVTVGIAAVLFALALAALFELVTITAPLAGISVLKVMGVLQLGLGLAVVGFGVGSRYNVFQSSPQPSAGLVAAGAFGGIWFVIGGLVASQTLGLGAVGWVPLALLVGGGAFLGTALPREDLGSTVPAGLIAVLAGVVFLTGIIGQDWSWAPAGLNAAFDAALVVPAIVQFTSLLLGWSAAKAYGGFGARGRHIGAYMLVGLNVTAILLVLGALVLFVTIRGLPGLLQGLAIGAGAGPEVTVVFWNVTLFQGAIPVSWPFLMNGVSILAEVDGVLPAIVGTVWLVVGAVVFAVPMGVGAAVFLSEYAEQGRFTQVVEVATNGLWSTPSIVFGLFGFAFLVPRFGNSKSLLSGMLTLGFMLLPLVLITSREAMLAVPDEYRDASVALGATKWQTVRSVVLPAAIPGITTGVILGVGRIAGETAPILLTMAGGTFTSASRTVDVIGSFQFTSTAPFVSNPALLQSTSALPYQLFAIITAGLGGGQLANPTHFAWGLALTLLAVVLSFYAIGIATRYYFRKRLHR